MTEEKQKKKNRNLQKFIWVVLTLIVTAGIEESRLYLHKEESNSKLDEKNQAIIIVENQLTQKESEYQVLMQVRDSIMNKLRVLDYLLNDVSNAYGNKVRRENYKTDLGNFSANWISKTVMPGDVISYLWNTVEISVNIARITQRGVLFNIQGCDYYTVVNKVEEIGPSPNQLADCNEDRKIIFTYSSCKDNDKQYNLDEAEVIEMIVTSFNVKEQTAEIRIRKDKLKNIRK